MGDKRYYPMLSCLKGLCALMVVQIHVDSSLREFIIPFCRIAVPVFFLITGYFVGNGDSVVLDRQIRKLVKITLTLQLIYFLWLFGVKYFANPQELTMFTNPRTYLRLILFGDTLCGPLWYLVALIQALLIILIFKRFNVLGLAKVIAYFSLIISFVAGTYGFLLDFDEAEIEYVRNGLTRALPLLFIGSAISNISQKRFITAGLLISATTFIGVFVEHRWIYRNGWFNYELSLSSLLLAVGLFVLAIGIDNSSTNRKRNGIIAKVESLGRRHSSNIYFFHMLVFLVLSVVSIKLQLNKDFIFLMTILFTVMLSELILRLKAKFSIISKFI